LHRPKKPFLLYVGFAHTHTPLAYDNTFANISDRPGAAAIFGNALAELDHAVGRIVSALDSTGLRNETLLVVTADNGPADLGVVDCDFIGSSGPFTGTWQVKNGGKITGVRKTTTWEGGHRMPALFSWPGRILPGRTDALGSTLDLLPTFLALSDVPLPSDRAFDGTDLSPVLFSELTDWSMPRILFHPDGHGHLSAGRLGKYKFFTKTFGRKPCFRQDAGESATDNDLEADLQISERQWLDAPLTFDLSVDKGEATPVVAPADVVETYLIALDTKMQSIAQTLSHEVDWSQNGTTAWPCCNRASSSCRCAASASVLIP